jgi:hypothetical protein
MAKHVQKFTKVDDTVTQSCGPVVMGICCLNPAYSTLRAFIPLAKQFFSRDPQRTRDEILK